MNKELLRVVGMMLAGAICAGLGMTITAQRAAAQDKAAPPAAAPTGAGQILGVVKDGDGKPIAGMTVIIEPQSGLEIDLTTNAEGKFAKPGLPVGTYVITYKQDDKTIYKVRANVANGKDTIANLDLTIRRYWNSRR